MYSMRKYILILLLLFASAPAAQTTADSRYGEIYNIISRVMDRLENIYSDYYSYEISPPKVRILSDKEYIKEYCRVFKECHMANASEAIYHNATLYFRDDIDLNTPYGIGTVIHETVHYIQDKHNLINIKCIDWIEYEAMRLEEKLLKEFGYKPDESDNRYFAKWRNIYSMNLNEGRTDCK